MAKTKPAADFVGEARAMLGLAAAHPVGEMGGYGANQEVIYTRPPVACPSVLVDTQRDATATFMSNGSVGLSVKMDEGLEVAVLEGSFDNVEKREINVPSSNVWIELEGRTQRIVSLMNPSLNLNCAPDSVRVVKVGDPRRAMWYGASFRPGAGVSLETALRLGMVYTKSGPALLREVYVRNTGEKPIRGNLWAYFHTKGTQRFVYNKPLWYDAGMPLSLAETVVSCRVPYSDHVQIKRLSSTVMNLMAVDATCDYTTFVGDSSALSLLPQAVLVGRMLEQGAGRKLNRFTTPTIAANQYALNLRPGQSAVLQQSLLFVTDRKLIDRYREMATSQSPAYADMSRSFAAAGKFLLGKTPGVVKVAAQARAISAQAAGHPPFAVELPAQPAASDYANSVWTGVKDLYENCRAHGAKLAQGIELGTRDRAQDMWPKMKEDPGRVRADLIHALGMMYQTQHRAPQVSEDRPLTLPEKLHGMFPRQYPSRWDDRTQAVKNDNRPYTDSPVWLINALNLYLRETGDVSILNQTVTTIRLTDPEHPEQSSILGDGKTQRLGEAVLETFACFQRHIDDSPYGLAQVLYGDWSDPIDMFGTSIIGDAATRGRGRGGQVRLSAHLVLCLVETIDTLEAPAVRRATEGWLGQERIEALKVLANRLRQNVMKVAWEDGGGDFRAGFIDCIHELKRDGQQPDYAAGEIGYTLGSMKKKDFDGINRRVLTTQAYGLEMLLADRDYLAATEGRDEMVQRILRTIDTLFYHPRLGLLLYTAPIANNARSLAMAGRMGILPAGCAENGEYHHAQVFMHRYRLDVPGEADAVWKQFQPIMSAMRDESLGGPFETPSTSYASDPADPHFGQGMYFGLSGSVDWIVEVFQKLAGLELNLHDSRRPAVKVEPNLPGAFEGQMTFRRMIHATTGDGRYRAIPLTVRLDRQGEGRRLVERRVKINGKATERAEVQAVGELRRLEIELVEVRGR